jgi:hypothetical protein
MIFFYFVILFNAVNLKSEVIMSNILKLLQDDLKQENYSGITYETIGARLASPKPMSEN